MANEAEAVWKTVREINLTEIRKAALMTITVGLIGSEDELVWLQEHLSGDARDPGDRRRVSDALKLFEAPPTEEMLPAINACTFVCISPGAADELQRRNLQVTAPIFTIGNQGEWEHFKRELLDTRWDLHLAVGRNLPGIRSDVIEYTVTNMSCVNGEVAVVSALFAKIPGIGPIYPGVAFGDTIIITKNQVMMAFRLAGACGLSIDLVHRKSDVLSIIFGGFGFRMAARELVGLVPGVGIPLKGAVAYAGTYAVGKTVAHFFDTGSRLPRAEQQRLYRQAIETGRTVANNTFRRLARRQARFRRRGNQAAGEA